MSLQPLTPDMLTELVRPSIERMVGAAIDEIVNEAVEKLRDRLRTDTAKLAIDLTGVVSFERRGMDLVITVCFPDSKAAKG